MKVVIPSKYAVVIARLRDPSGKFFRITDCEDHFEIEVTTGLSFERAALGLTPKEFGAFYRDIKVWGGAKKKSGDHIAFEPRRPLVVSIRFAESELSLVQKAAEQMGVTVREFIRFSALSRALMPTGGGGYDGPCQDS